VDYGNHFHKRHLNHQGLKNQVQSPREISYIAYSYGIIRTRKLLFAQTK
jgi:hypothetical protein